MTQIEMFPTAISSQPVIPVSRSPTPVSASDMRMTATSGRTSCKLLHKNDPLGAVSRMFMVMSQWASTKCFLTWKVKATPQGRLLFQLAPSMRPTEETGSGLLHTPTATANQMAPSMVAKGSGYKPRQMMPTPTASDHIERNSTSTEAVNPLTGKSVSLDRFVRFWPDEATQKMLGNHPGIRGTTPEEWKAGSLNPQFVEWLMGYPAGWTNLETPQEQSKASKDEPTD